MDRRHIWRPEAHLLRIGSLSPHCQDLWSARARPLTAHTHEYSNSKFIAVHKYRNQVSLALVRRRTRSACTSPCQSRHATPSPAEEGAESWYSRDEAHLIRQPLLRNRRRVDAQLSGLAPLQQQLLLCDLLLSFRDLEYGVSLYPFSTMIQLPRETYTIHSLILISLSSLSLSLHSPHLQAI